MLLNTKIWVLGSLFTLCRSTSILAIFQFIVAVLASQKTQFQIYRWSFAHLEILNLELAVGAQEILVIIWLAH